MDYEEVIKNYTCKQLVYERAILIKQYKTIQKQLSLLDEEFNRRLKDGTDV